MTRDWWLGRSERTRGRWEAFLLGFLLGVLSNTLEGVVDPHGDVWRAWRRRWISAPER